MTSLAVRFGGVPASSVEVLDGRTARAVTPAVPEGTGAVTVEAANSTGGGASLPDAFLFEHPAPPFLRGDVTGDGSRTITDVVTIGELVLGSPSVEPPENLDAADVNDDGSVNAGDVTRLMSYLFASGSPPPPPVVAPGLDPTPDAITSCPP